MYPDTSCRVGRNEREKGSGRELEAYKLRFANIVVEAMESKSP